MKNCSVLENQPTLRNLLSACAIGLAVAFTASPPQPASADPVTPPPVPDAIVVPEGNVAFLEGHAVGTMNYVCLPCAISPTCTSGFAFSLFTPEATLSKDNDKQIITHFFSPNPDEGGKVRPTWQDSKDTSTVWGGDATPSSDPDFVAPGAVPWLRLPEAGVQEGPTGGKTLTKTTFIQRLNTSGGVAPSTGCASSTVGSRAFVPYTANYFFYTTAP
jgi:uncharacterized protein DUF3455